VTDRQTDRLKEAGFLPHESTSFPSARLNSPGLLQTRFPPG
jgi:hypothetical protein